MKGNPDRVSSCTSPHFEGIISIVDPEASWVARWQRIAKNVRGIYAVRVSGTIPEDVEDELANRGITYRPRDHRGQDGLFTMS